MINLNLSKTNYPKTLAQNFAPKNNTNFNFKKNISFEGKGKYTQKALSNSFTKTQNKKVYFSKDEIEIIKKIFETDPKKAINIIKTCIVETLLFLKVCSSFKSNSTQGKLVWADVNLTKKSIVEDKDIADVLVPMFETNEDGIENVDVGDVFEIEGEKNIFIKTQDDLSQELKISKKAYCRLFPAVYRYSSGQQKSQDCYLVAVLNAIMVNPNARIKLLSCFNEKEDKSISAKLPTSDTEIIIQQNETIEDLGVKKSQHMNNSLGMQLLEYLYKLSLLEKSDKNLNDKNKTAEKIGGNGGYPEDVFTAFGFEDAIYIDLYKNEDAVDNLLLDLLLNKNFVVTAGITSKEEYKQDLKKLGIKEESYSDEQQEFLNSLPTQNEVKKASLVSNHTYSINVQLDENSGELQVIAVNPWANISSKNKEVVLSTEGFKKYFSDICVGCIN